MTIDYQAATLTRQCRILTNYCEVFCFRELLMTFYISFSFIACALYSSVYELFIAILSMNKLQIPGKYTYDVLQLGLRILVHFCFLLVGVCSLVRLFTRCIFTPGKGF